MLDWRTPTSDESERPGLLISERGASHSSSSTDESKMEKDANFADDSAQTVGYRSP